MNRCSCIFWNVCATFKIWQKNPQVYLKYVSSHFLTLTMEHLVRFR